MLDDNDIIKLSETFLTKEEFKEELKNLATKDELIEFKDEILTGQDEILTKLDILLNEKPVKDEQDKRQKKVLEIHNNALKTSKILSDGEVLEIDNLRAF